MNVRGSGWAVLRRSLFAALFLLWTHQSYAAPPAFRAISAIAASTGADITITVDGACATSDIMILLAWVRDVDDTVQVDATGDTWEQISTACTSACAPNIERSTVSSYWVFWERHDGSIDTTVVFNKSDTTGNAYGAIACYSGAITTGTPFEAIGSFVASTSDPTSVTAISTLSADALVVVPVGGEDNNNGAITTTGTDPAAYTEHYAESGTGDDGAITFSEAARTTPGSTGTISVDWDTANPVGSGGVALVLAPIPPVVSCVPSLTLLGVARCG